MDYVLLVGAATRMPMVARLLEASNMAHALSRGVHTEEAAALGAAIEGGILSGIIKDKVVTATVPHSLGIETAGNTAFPVIERDSLFPTAGRQSFTTATNGQTEVEIRILEGEGDRASDNRVLGSFRLSGVPPERAGLRTLEVTFDIDANGRLTVAALDLASGIQGGLTLSGRGSPPAESPPDLAAQIVPAEGAEVQQLLRAVRGLVSDGRLPLVSQERYQLNADMVRAEEVLKEGDEKQQARAVKALRKSLALFLEAVRKEQRKAEAGALSQEPAREEDGA